MARLRNIIHSQDACTMVFEGNPSKPEPSLGAIKFPGGRVEVSRVAGEYWAHISVDDGIQITDSRIDYDREHSFKNGIPDVPDAQHIKHIAVRVAR